jgi:hypothetical protein
LTYEDLSRLLFADRKTIGHYIQELRAEGQRIVTFVTIITPEELQTLADGTRLRHMRPQIAARIMKEAYDQGGVLSFSTVGLLTSLSSSKTISLAVTEFYKQNPDVVLPHSGTILDMGTTLTHKRAAVLLKHLSTIRRLD